MSRISLWALAIAVTTISLSVMAKDKKPLEWRTGTLLDSSTERGTRHVPINGNIQEMRNDQSYYEIDDGEKYVYVVRRSMTSRWDKPIPLTVNAPIKFAIDGSDLLLLDEKGKQHRLAIEKKTLKKQDPK
jgi:hypothetical protein